MSALVQLLYGFGCMIVGALLYALVEYVSHERHESYRRDYRCITEEQRREINLNMERRHVNGIIRDLYRPDVRRRK